MSKFGQTDCGGRIRHRRCGDLFRVLRRASEQGDGKRKPRSGKCAELHDARACWRGGANYPVELSAADGRVETGAGDCGRMLLRTEAGGADASDSPGVCKLD